jgi:hypothetical protein
MGVTRIRNVLAWAVAFEIIIAVVGLGFGYAAEQAARVVEASGTAPPAEILGRLTMAVVMATPGILALTVLVFTVPLLAVTQLVATLQGWRRRENHEWIEHARRYGVEDKHGVGR